jgi:membrane-bound lytic murein transglycosylase A
MRKIQAVALFATILLGACSGIKPGEAPAECPTCPVCPGCPTAAPLPPALPFARTLRPAAWTDLPGWADDRASALWPALRAGCVRPAPGWAGVCQRAAGFNPADDGAVRGFLQRELQPYRVESNEGEAQGLATGYFEPLVTASRRPRPGFTVPVHRPPADLAQRRPWYTRQQIDTLPAAAAALRGQEIAWLASPLDLLILQIQGSGRLQFTEADGASRTVRLAFAGHNDQPYKSVGRWLIEQGELRAEGANWPAIRAWGERAGPARLQQMLWANPRVVFFREEPLGELEARFGPRGAQGVALTPGRSIAVDRDSIPYGTPVWLRSSGPAAQFEKLVLAQDTGSAIVGAVRADYFTGWGDQAYTLAAGLKQPLELWALWPRSQ